MKLLRKFLNDKVSVYQATPCIDERGSLVPIDLSEIHFPTKRIFLVRASSNVERGGHGHYAGRQFLMPITGKITVELLYEGCMEIEQLSSPENCLLIEAGVWSRQIYADETSALLVCCDTSYDESDYFYTKTQIVSAKTKAGPKGSL
ncbi:FdtA/QdtA family cupin domain-containing protein [uncultured Sneathiella sp.]|uniref:sugar 3,4-ketoisomerase n=1 Tax=uncultured Sneathiella sp. TaxID=879315 RepID=UPI002595C07F|nr:FdtA/QdtA family cupin domain-containing protein [uncultured Sneathiella sp.]